jgi:hypothetical protein
MDALSITNRIDWIFARPYIRADRKIAAGRFLESPAMDRRQA